MRADRTFGTRNLLIPQVGKPEKGSVPDLHMLQALAAFAVLHRSAYPVAEF
jgi:hypothetical protein